MVDVDQQAMIEQDRGSVVSLLVADSQNLSHLLSQVDILEGKLAKLTTHLAKLMHY